MWLVDTVMPNRMWLEIIAQKTRRWTATINDWPQHRTIACERSNVLTELFARYERQFQPLSSLVSLGRGGDDGADSPLAFMQRE